MSGKDYGDATQKSQHGKGHNPFDKDFGKKPTAADKAAVARKKKHHHHHAPAKPTPAELRKLALLKKAKGYN